MFGRLLDSLRPFTRQGRRARARMAQKIARGSLAGGEFLEQRLALAQTVGLFVNDPAAQAGYTLFNASFTPTTYLVDSNGQQVHSWTSTGGATSVYLQPDGSLLRNTMLPPQQRVFGNSGATGKIEIRDWDNEVDWSWTLADAKYQLHHDSIRLPNGNVLAIAWERLSKAEAVALGRNPALLNPATNNELWPEVLFEIKPDLDKGSGGEIVWEWHMKDHLVQSFDPAKPNYVKPSEIAKNPQRIDINFVPTGMGADNHIADWAHFNAVAYDPKSDRVMVSSREFSEIWMIDKSTTSAEAAGKAGGKQGKGGDLLWRYGNPLTWQAGSRTSQQLFFQHNIHWIDEGLPGAGNLLVFNNGYGRPDGSNWSSVMELVPDGYGKAKVVWSYGSPSAGFFSPIVSGAQRLPNGNTLIDEGTTGRFFEVTRTGRTVWQYVDPAGAGGPYLQGTRPPVVNVGGVPGVQSNLTFRAERYLASDPAFAGRTLTPGKLIEKYPTFYATPGFFDPATGTWTLNHHADGTSTAVTRVTTADNQPSIVGGQTPKSRALVRPFTGDFTGTGVSSTALYDGATGQIRIDLDNDGVADRITTIAGAGAAWLPLAGNWDGTGADEIGLWDPLGCTFRYYTLEGTQAAPPFKTPWVPATWKPLAGDWNGDGKDTCALYDPFGHTFWFNDKIDGSLTTLRTFVTPALPATWQPIAGDWNGDRKDTFGLYDPAARTFYLNNRVDGSINDLVVFSLPAAGSAVPVAGNWGTFPGPRQSSGTARTTSPDAALLAAAVTFDPQAPARKLTAGPPAG